MKTKTKRDALLLKNPSLVLEKLSDLNEPSITELSEVTGSDRSTISRVVKELEEDGYLEIIGEEGGGRGKAKKSVLTAKGEHVVEVLE